MSSRRLESLSPFGPRPQPTPAQGPDPYGDPDPEWLRVDWRDHLKTINVPPASSASRPGAAGSAAGTTVHYVELRPPEAEQHRLAIVFVHGLSGCWQNWLDQLPHFADRHRLIALDLPGFGRSPSPEWKISIPNYARLLRRLCDALDVRDTAVVGHSMGGFVAAEAVIDQPDRFEKLVLVSAAGVSSVRLRREPTEVAARMIAAGAPYAFNLQTRTFRRPRARAIAFSNIVRHPSRLRPELLWEFFQGGIGGDGFTDALSSLAGYDFLDRFDDVEVPSLIVWGRNDNVVPPGDALEYARLLSNSETEVFDDCGHIPQVEHPARFNRVLERFVSS